MALIRGRGVNRLVTALAVLLVAAAAGCDQRTNIGIASTGGSSGRLDREASQTCAVFAANRAHATGKAARLKLADSLARRSGRSDTTLVTTRVTRLGRDADKGDRAWNSSAAALADACHRAGWRPPRPKRAR